jgi:hypothetical protein
MSDHLSPIRLAIIRRIADYCTDFQVSTDSLGRMSLGDHKVCGRLRRGEGVQLARIETLLAFIESDRRRRTAAGEGVKAA